MMHVEEERSGPSPPLHTPCPLLHRLRQHWLSRGHPPVTCWRRSQPPPPADSPCVPAEKLCTSASARSAAVTTQHSSAISRPGPLSVTHSNNPLRRLLQLCRGTPAAADSIGRQSCDSGEKRLRVTNRFCNTLRVC